MCENIVLPRIQRKNLLFKSSHRRCSVRKGVLINFAKFTGKHLCQSLFFNKVAGLRPATLFKKRLWHRCFPVNLTTFLRTHFFIEHPRVTALVYYITRGFIRGFYSVFVNSIHSEKGLAASRIYLVLPLFEILCLQEICLVSKYYLSSLLL